MPVCSAMAWVFSSCAWPAHMREFAFERHDLRRPHRRADDVPERGFSGGRGDADARWPAVDVVGDIGRLDVPGERPDAPSLGLREQRMIGQPLIGQKRLQRSGAAAESQRIDRQHRDVGGDVVTPISRCLVFAEERFAHDHPQGIAGRRAVACGEHEFVAVRVFGATVVETEASVLVTGKVRDDVERRVGQRPAKMAGLRVVAEPHESHAGHEADVFHSLPVVRQVEAVAVCTGCTLMLYPCPLCVLVGDGRTSCLIRRSSGTSSFRRAQC